MCSQFINIVYFRINLVSGSKLLTLEFSKLAKPSKFLSPPQAYGVLRNFAPSGSDFVKTWNPRSKLRGIPFR